MSETNEKQASFLGTYFDRDGVLRLSRWADAVAWVVLTVYILTWLAAFCCFSHNFSMDCSSAKGCHVPGRVQYVRSLFAAAAARFVLLLWLAWRYPRGY